MRKFLLDDEIEDIRNKILEGYAQRDLAEIFDVHESTISLIKSNNRHYSPTWGKHAKRLRRIKQAIPNERINRIKALRAKGYSYREIAERTKVSYPTAYKYAKTVNIK